MTCEAATYGKDKWPLATTTPEETILNFFNKKRPGKRYVKVLSVKPKEGVIYNFTFSVKGYIDDKRGNLNKFVCFQTNEPGKVHRCTGKIVLISVNIIALWLECRDKCTGRLIYNFKLNVERLNALIRK